MIYDHDIIFNKHNFCFFKYRFYKHMGEGGSLLKYDELFTSKNYNLIFTEIGDFRSEQAIITLIRCMSKLNHSTL